MLSRLNSPIQRAEHGQAAKKEEELDGEGSDVLMYTLTEHNVDHFQLIAKGGFFFQRKKTICQGIVAKC